MASKFDQFLKASWIAIFSVQEAPRGASAADRRSGWSRPEPTGGGFRRGKTRTSEKKNPEGDKKKNPETLSRRKWGDIIVRGSFFDRYVLLLLTNITSKNT